MEIDISPDKYVVAVSGGVDSMVLLDVLARTPGLQLIVAHFDHGIRPDSDQDRTLVEKAAHAYGLPFVCAKGNLSPDASEETARKARYEFLEKTRVSMGVQAIITAHHEDDVLETAILNLLRGTGRRGMTSLSSGGVVIRPLLHVSKEQILGYASEHGISWREDSTNADMRYRRNYVRRHIVPKLGEQGKRRLLHIIETLRRTNIELDTELERFLSMYTNEEKLQRSSFILLPHTVSREVMAAWLRGYGYAGYDRRTLERLVIAAKTYQPGRVADVQKGVQMRIEKGFLALSASDR